MARGGAFLWRCTNVATKRATPLCTRPNGIAPPPTGGQLFVLCILPSACLDARISPRNGQVAYTSFSKNGHLAEGTDLLLLAPRLDEGMRESFLGALDKSTPQKARMPVIVLSTTVEEDLPEKEGVIGVPWPCERKVLVQRIEAALLDAPEASAAPTTQAGTG